jgi:hypothetical protein
MKINDTLGCELTPDKRHIRIVREKGGLVYIRLDEAKALVAALIELAARAVAEVGDT